MGPEIVIGVIGTVVSVAGVAVGYLQYRHAKEESQHLRKLVDHAEKSPRTEPVSNPVAAQPQQIAESAPASPPPPPPVPAMPPVPKSRTAALEAALIVARGLASPYERDKKRAEVFEEAVRRRQHAFAASIIREFENTYDRERCKERMTATLLTVRDPEVAREVTEAMQMVGRR